MKKNISLIFAVLCGFLGYAQSTATDFTIDDCAGNSQNLFSQLNSGKVIVITWVMPCFSCTGPAITAYNVASSYSSSHPDRVLYYLVDDYGNTSCTSLNSWSGSNSIYANSVFSNASLKMSDYGVDGMPKVVVLGGADHKVFFNKNNSDAGDPDGIQAAIDQALIESAGLGLQEASSNISDLEIYPNPVRETANISFSMTKSESFKLQVFNILGMAVETMNFEAQGAGTRTIKLNTSSYSSGIYLVKIGDKTTKLMVSN